MFICICCVSIANSYRIGYPFDADKNDKITTAVIIVIFICVAACVFFWV